MPILPIDLAVNSFFLGFHPEGFDPLMQLISYLGSAIPALVLTIIFCLALFYYKKNREAIFLLISTSGALAGSFIIKHLIERSRPNPILAHDSFPSGHVLFFMGLFGFLLYLAYTKLPKTYFRKLVLIKFSLLIILIGISRMSLQEHWLTDVLASYILGLIWLSLVIKLYNDYK